MMRRIDEGQWKVDRHVPIALIMTLLVQMGGALVWAAQLDARVGDVERQSVNSANLNEKFARLEERLDNVRQDLGGMKRQLDHLTDNLIGQ